MLKNQPQSVSDKHGESAARPGFDRPDVSGELLFVPEKYNVGEMRPGPW